MPKRAADSVQSIRIELQETERAALEASLTAGGIANLLHGVGAVLLPFQGAFTALMAAWLAGEIVDEVKEQLDKVIGGVRGEISKEGAQQYQAITAYLYPLSWDSFDYEEAGEFKKGPDGKKTTLPAKWMRQRFQAFMNQTKQSMFISEMERLNTTPAEAWSLFYPWDEMVNEAIYHTNQAVSRTSWWLDLITPNPK